jgi:opacity protein-like surface antigen
MIVGAILILSALAAAQAASAEAAETVFACSFGARQVEVVRDGGRLTYRFGRPGRPELELAGDAASGTLFYHRTLYARGEDQTLRFTSGDFSYVIFSGWSAPNRYLEGARNDSGLLVLRGARVIRRMNCREGGDFLENPLFFTLPQDGDNLVPES